MRYQIFQLNKDGANREYAFQWVSMLKARQAPFLEVNEELDQIYFDIDAYRQVYSGDPADLGIGYDENLAKFRFDSPRILEELFCIFNTQHPADYHGWSMSVGDIVTLEMSGVKMAFFCDMAGWADCGIFSGKDRAESRERVRARLRERLAEMKNKEVSHAGENETTHR
jgi:hypothetical protein